jgi:hypothetical protein
MDDFAARGLAVHALASGGHGGHAVVRIALLVLVLVVIIVAVVVGWIIYARRSRSASRLPAHRSPHGEAQPYQWTHRREHEPRHHAHDTTSPASVASATRASARRCRGPR